MSSSNLFIYIDHIVWTQNTSEEGLERLQESEDWDVYCEIVCSIYDKEAAFKNFQLYGCLNKT